MMHVWSTELRGGSRAGRPWPIRIWLILLVLATIAPLASYGLFGTLRSYQAERHELANRTVTLARLTGRTVERLLEQQLVGVEALAGDPGLAVGQYAEFTPIAANYLATVAPGGEITLSNRAGAILYSIGSSGSLTERGGARAYPTINRRLFAAGNADVRLVPGAVGGRWLVAVDAPVRRNGRVVADLTLDLPAERVQALLAAERVPRGWTAIVTDGRGRLAARIPPAPAMIGRIHARDVLDFLASGRSVERLQTRLLDGNQVVGALTRTAEFGWATGVAIPESLMLSPLRASISRLIGVGLVALALSLMLAMLVARRLARPIIALADMASKFDRAEEIPAAPPPSLREADDVARALELAMRRRRAAEAAAEAAEMRASRVIEHTPCGVVVLDAHGAWRFVNHATCDLFGRSAEDLLGCTLSWPELDLRDHEGQPVPIGECASTRALRGETVRGMEVSIVRGDGRRMHMLLNSAPLRDPAGRITGALTAMLDISDRLAVEERLAGLLHTLEVRVQEEVAAREAAQLAAAQAQKMQALGQLAGGVAHDFNNVLQAISGAVSLIESRANNPDAVRRFANTAASAAERGAAVAGRLLAFARRSDLVAAPVNAVVMLADLREILVHTLGADVAVRVEASAEVGWLLADRAQLETALVNLATNARDAMPGGGVLTLGARRVSVPGAVGVPPDLRAGDYVRIEVQDTGTGMDAATLAHAAEPFFTTKPIDKGTGLGLAMVRGFAEQLGGGLTIASRPGEGTCVSVWLPAAVAPGEKETARRALAPVRPASGLRVLLVDDEPTVRSVLAEQLNEHGWRIEQAGCAQAAIELLRESNFDLLVADQSMPGETGITLIGLARRLRPRLPAILLTGFAPDIGEKLTDRPEDAAITEIAGKPIRAADLIRQVELLLARAHGESVE